MDRVLPLSPIWAVGVPTLALGLVAARSGTGALAWSGQPPSGALTGTTVVTRNLLLARAEGAGYGIDLAARRQVWSYPATGHLALASHGVLLMARPGGKLSAIDLE